MDHEYEQTVLKAESDMLSRMIEELEAKRDEISTNLDKLYIVRAALVSKLDQEEQLELDLETESDS